MQAETYQWLAEAIVEADLNFDVWAYVFMPEHVHLIVCPREAVASDEVPIRVDPIPAEWLDDLP